MVFCVAGKAETAAWYVGSALGCAYIFATADVHTSLTAIAITLAGFWCTRIVRYAIDGVDEDRQRRLTQHAVFGFEILGTIIALALR